MNRLILTQQLAAPLRLPT